MLGLPEDQFGHFFRLASDLLHIGYDPVAAFVARDELGTFLTGQIEDRRSQPGDDLISALVTAQIDGEQLPESMIIANLRQLIPAGIETTYRSTASMWVHLLQAREQFDTIVTNRSLVPSAVEEALRIDGPALMTPRIATRDTELLGVLIPAGSGVLVSQAMANRDPARWEEPDRFDITRPSQPQAAFIAGAHTCLGIHLARSEMQAGLRCVAQYLPDIRLTFPDAEHPIIGCILRAPASCPITCG
jgi:cytochrome P450